MANGQTVVEVDGGKYKVVILDNGGTTVYRNGEKWLDETGNNLIYWLVIELAEERRKNAKLLSSVEYVEAPTDNTILPNDFTRAFQPLLRRGN